ncbi:MAG: tetratricopeptide repeat protein [Desulfobulbaceae bacterium]|nr:tetratricopeptide repeat protein [Desulfobulbaceae bacterium]
MSNQINEHDGYIKKESMWIFVLVAFALGFLAGIVFSVYKSPSQTPVSQPQVQQQSQNQPQSAAPSQNEANILALEKEVLINPNNVDAWTQLGNYYFDSQKFSKAINAYTKSLELSPDNANVITDLGIMYRRNGNPQQAIASFEKALAIDPNHPSARFNKGIVQLYDLKDREGALQTWEEVVRLNPAATAPNGQLVSEIITSVRNDK